MATVNETGRTGADFCLEIGFERGTESPARVFRALTELIDACELADRVLIQSIDARIRPVLLLEDIEAASIKTWLREQIEGLDDESLRKLEWKPLVGHYLVKAKYRIIDFLGGRTTISNRMEIIDLQRELLAEAERAQIKPIPIESPVPEADVVRIIHLLTDPLAQLRDGDTASYITADEETPFNLAFSVTPKAIEDLITKETLTNEAVMILKVKRPDYLGDSMWDFRYEGRPLEAKILHWDWLRRFQERKEELRPGDALRALIKTDVRYGYDGEVIGTHYSVTKVLEVIRVDSPGSTAPLPL